MRRTLLAVGVAVGLLGAVVAEAQQPTPAGGPRKGFGGGGRGGGARGPGAAGGKGGAGAAGAEAEGGRRPTAFAEGFLKQGNFRAAASGFREEIAKNPEAPAPHVGLGKALARMGRCNEALAELWPQVGMKPFGDEAALLASICAGRLGLHDDALYFSAMAAEMDPNNPRALTQYALSLADVGDLEGVDRVIGQLEVLPGPKDASLYARSVLALRAGDIDEFDRLIFFWPDDRSSVRDLARLEAQSWLDMDDPVQVVSAIKQVKRLRRGRSTTWTRAEAVRRLGEAEDAMELLSTRNAKQGEGSESDAVKARVLADLHDFDGAAAVLAQYPDDIDAELIASEWYLAWRRGDTAKTAELADAYRRERVSPLRSLEQLIPWPDRTD